MLKLTGRVNGLPCYVAIPHIVVIDSEPEGASLWLMGLDGHLPVRETADEIMAMEAMVYHLHPPIIMSANAPSWTNRGR